MSLVLPLSAIAVVERRRKDLGDLDSLVRSIQLNGQITSGVVRKATSDDVTRGVDPSATPYVLVAGGRRYAACVAAGLDHFRADDFGELPLLTQKILELEENLNRKELNWDEEVLLKEEIHELREREAADRGEVWLQGDTARELHETQANTSRDLALAKELRNNPELRKAPSKASAVRQVAFDRKIEQRTAAINQTPMLHVSDRLHTADMREFVRILPTHSVDLTFTDFPYGVNYFFEEHDRNAYEDTPEQLKDLLTDVIPEIIRVTKPTGWLALMMSEKNFDMLQELIRSCCATHFEYANTWWEEQPNGDWKWMRASACNAEADGHACRFIEPEVPAWMWYKPNSRSNNRWPEKHCLSGYERLCVVNMGEAVLVKKGLLDVIVCEVDYGGERIHEMQRPHSMCKEVIERLTLGGERVLDLCFGSGSALAAAAELQRDFLGCDINPKNLGPALMWVAEHYKPMASPRAAGAKETR